MEGIDRPRSVRSALFSPTMALNSSALYAGHTLHDYLFKGPDPLNNLVDVVIQFCENLIATCGAIVKVYHMIAIPEDEQHVHRFLWRNFEAVVISYIHTFIEASPFAISTCPIILFLLGGKLAYACRLSCALLQLCFDKWAKTTFAVPQIVQTGETGNETSNSIGFPKIRL